MKSKPDNNVMVEYDGGFPIHAIHLWLGEEDEKSTLMYMVGEGETYLTPSKDYRSTKGINTFRTISGTLENIA